MIIASDFLEETNAPEPLPVGALAGTKVLLLYRPVSPDREVGGQMTARIESWRQSLEQFGAVVTKVPDSGYEQSDLVSFYLPSDFSSGGFVACLKRWLLPQPAGAQLSAPPRLQ
uniref:Uncharacterized protein n=1 Tax=Phenylobacterium glaciei TaxID=2803784 RepID=A0A974P0Z0_9CAUL|nr:hypothetical protein JKL49_16610 [Phenylobacterium glaciei]